MILAGSVCVGPVILLSGLASRDPAPHPSTQHTRAFDGPVLEPFSPDEGPSRTRSSQWWGCPEPMGSILNGRPRSEPCHGSGFNQNHYLDVQKMTNGLELQPFGFFRFPCHCRGLFAPQELKLAHHRKVALLKVHLREEAPCRRVMLSVLSFSVGPTIMLSDLSAGTLRPARPLSTAVRLLRRRKA